MGQSTQDITNEAVQDAVNRVNAGFGTLADRELAQYALDAQEAEMETQLARQLAARRFQKNIKESPIETAFQLYEDAGAPGEDPEWLDELLSEKTSVTDVEDMMFDEAGRLVPKPFV